MVSDRNVHTFVNITHLISYVQAHNICGHRQVLYIASEFWNRLPKYIREIEKTSFFKTKEKEHPLALL